MATIPNLPQNRYDSAGRTECRSPALGSRENLFEPKARDWDRKLASGPGASAKVLVLAFASTGAWGPARGSLINFHARRSHGGSTDIPRSTAISDIQPPIRNRTSSQSRDLFKCEKTTIFAGATAEVPVTNLYRDRDAGHRALPISLCAYTPCFRSEGGSYGRDVRAHPEHQFRSGTGEFTRGAELMSS